MVQFWLQIHTCFNWFKSTILNKIKAHNVISQQSLESLGVWEVHLGFQDMIICMQLKFKLLFQLEMSKPIPPQTYHAFLTDHCHYILTIFSLDVCYVEHTVEETVSKWTMPCDGDYLSILCHPHFRCCFGCKLGAIELLPTLFWLLCFLVPMHPAWATLTTLVTVWWPLGVCFGVQHVQFRWKSCYFWASSKFLHWLRMWVGMLCDLEG